MSRYTIRLAKFLCTKCGGGYCTKRGMTRGSHEAIFMAKQQGWTCRICGCEARSRNDPYRHTCGQCRASEETSRIEKTLAINDAFGHTTKSQRRARNRRETSMASILAYAQANSQEPLCPPPREEKMVRGPFLPVMEKPICGICTNVTASRATEDRRTFACASCSEKWFQLGGPKVWCVLVHTRKTEK
jgi:hypothetical protein